MSYYLMGDVKSILINFFMIGIPLHFISNTKLNSVRAPSVDFTTQIKINTLYIFVSFAVLYFAD